MRECLKIALSDNAMNAVDEMRKLIDDIKLLFDAYGAEYPTWKELEGVLFKHDVNKNKRKTT